MLSLLGRCHTFDHRADGYCRGEGCGTFEILQGAERGILVHGSAVRQDGPSASLTAPNGSSQRQLLAAVKRSSESGESGLEAHGTGTALGDPIEVGAAAGVLCAELGLEVQCTSAKANVGHLEASAAAAGLLGLVAVQLRES